MRKKSVARPRSPNEPSGGWGRKRLGDKTNPTRGPPPARNEANCRPPTTPAAAARNEANPGAPNEPDGGLEGLGRDDGPAPLNRPCPRTNPAGGWARPTTGPAPAEPRGGRFPERTRRRGRAGRGA